MRLKLVPFFHTQFIFSPALGGRAYHFFANICPNRLLTLAILV